MKSFSNKLGILTTILASAFTSTTTAQNLYNITSDEFDQVLTGEATGSPNAVTNSIWFAIFHVNWCTHCKFTVPQIRQAAEKLELDPDYLESVHTPNAQSQSAERSGAGAKQIEPLKKRPDEITGYRRVQFASIDVTDDKTLTNRFGLEGYPSILYWDKGVSLDAGYKDFRGGRHWQGILRYLERMTQMPEIKPIPDFYHVMAGLTMEAMPVYIHVSPDPQPPKWYQDYAHNHRDKHIFYHAKPGTIHIEKNTRKEITPYFPGTYVISSPAMTYQVEVRKFSYPGMPKQPSLVQVSGSVSNDDDEDDLDDDLNEVKKTIQAKEVKPNGSNTNVNDNDINDNDSDFDNSDLPNDNQMSQLFQQWSTANKYPGIWNGGFHNFYELTHNNKQPAIAFTYNSNTTDEKELDIFRQKIWAHFGSGDDEKDPKQGGSFILIDYVKWSETLSKFDMHPEEGHRTWVITDDFETWREDVQLLSFEKTLDIATKSKVANGAHGPNSPNFNKFVNTTQAVLNYCDNNYMIFVQGRSWYQRRLIDLRLFIRSVNKLYDYADEGPMESCIAMLIIFLAVGVVYFTLFIVAQICSALWESLALPELTAEELAEIERIKRGEDMQSVVNEGDKKKAAIEAGVLVDDVNVVPSDIKKEEKKDK